MRELGRVLTATEACTLADGLLAGETVTSAVQVVAAGRRANVRALLIGSALPREGLVAVLRAVEGARSTASRVEALWTMPGHVARAGRLTSSVSHLVDGARDAVTCSTYNLASSSGLWTALREAARRPEVGVRLYLDADVAGDVRAAHIARQLHPGVVLRSRPFDDRRVRNHAKFVAVDHRFLLVTSANLSWSAEHGNVELGLLVDDRPLTETIEREMRRAEDLLYERVRP